MAQFPRSIAAVVLAAFLATGCSSPAPGTPADAPSSAPPGGASSAAGGDSEPEASVATPGADPCDLDELGTLSIALDVTTVMADDPATAADQITSAIQQLSADRDAATDPDIRDAYEKTIAAATTLQSTLQAADGDAGQLDLAEAMSQAVEAQSVFAGVMEACGS